MLPYVKRFFSAWTLFRTRFGLDIARFAAESVGPLSGICLLLLALLPFSWSITGIQNQDQIWTSIVIVTAWVRVIFFSPSVRNTSLRTVFLQFFGTILLLALVGLVRLLTYDLQSIF